MHRQNGHTQIFALLLGLTVLAWAMGASADPPARVARLADTSGSVSFSPAGENEWMRAPINRPLTTGDHLWVDAGARAELQVGSSVIRMGELTSVTLLNLEDRVAQVQLAQGTLNIRVRRLGPNEVFEIATPNLAYSIRRPGRYRITVDPAGDTTTVVVRDGQAEVYGDGAAYLVNAQQAYRFAGTSLSDYEYMEAPRADEFDRWSSERDRRADNSVSARYVSRDVIGYEDLDAHGRWRSVEGYGNVWTPTRVGSGWAPYRDGHWSWVDPWGWTWVDDAPWGFAVSHYGRWANIGGTWGWVPGPVRSQAVYAPALVAFIVGSALQMAMSGGDAGGIAWFPLGPRDVYRPSYPVSRRYFNSINTSNTTINTTNITNVYNNVNVRNITYVNQRVPGAIVAVPNTAFVQSQPVGRAAVRLSREAIVKAPVTEVAAVAPVRASVRGAAAPGSRPPAEVLKRPVVAKAPPPPPPVPFAARQSALAAQPGRPLDAAALAAVKPTAPAPAPSVTVVSPTQPAVVPPRRQAVAPAAPQGQEATKGLQPPQAQKGPQRSEEKKGQRARDAQEAPRPPEARKPPAPPVSVPRPPEAQKAPPPPEAQRAPQPPEAKKGSRARDAEEAPRLPEAQKPPPPPVSVPRQPESQKAPPPPEAQRVPPPSEAKKGQRARDAQEAPRPPEAQPAPPPPVSVPRPPEAQKAPPPPEAQRAPPPPEAKKGRQAREAQEAPRPPEAQPAPPPPVSVPKPPEAQKAPPPPEAQKRPQRPEAREAPPPEARKPPPPPVSVPRPPEAQKAPPPKPEADKGAEKRGEKKSDEQLKREEKLKLEEKLRLEEKLKRMEEERNRKP